MVRNIEGRRKTKGDLKRKRLNRGYKRGGKFRTHTVSEEGNAVFESDEKSDLKASKSKVSKNKTKKSRK